MQILMYEIKLTFQRIILFVVGAILFLKILMVILNALDSDNKAWSPGIAPCPDYWDLSSDGKTCNMDYTGDSPNQNVGKLQYYGGRRGLDNYYGGAGAPIVGSTPTCEDEETNKKQTLTIPTSHFGNDKKSWAKQYGFVWDGLTSSGSDNQYTLKCKNSNPTKRMKIMNRLKKIAETEKTVLLTLTPILSLSIFIIYVTGYLNKWWTIWFVYPLNELGVKHGVFIAYILGVLVLLLSIGITMRDKKKRVKRFYRNNTDTN